MKPNPCTGRLTAVGEGHVTLASIIIIKPYHVPLFMTCKKKRKIVPTVALSKSENSH
jgi:hypothetical protein